MNPTIKLVEKKYIKDDVTPVRVGDTVRASLKVKEGNRVRLQIFEGVVIALDGEGTASAIKIRKISFSVGVEKTIPLNSPVLQKLEIVQEGKPRRAKLYYLRGRVGKAAVKVKPRTVPITKKAARAKAVHAKEAAAKKAESSANAKDASHNEAK